MILAIGEIEISGRGPSGGAIACFELLLAILGFCHIPCPTLKTKKAIGANNLRPIGMILEFQKLCQKSNAGQNKGDYLAFHLPASLS